MREFDPCNSDWQFPREPPEPTVSLEDYIDEFGFPPGCGLDDEVERMMPF